MSNNERYHRWYFAIIDRAHARELADGNDGYTERHHIIPKSLLGNSKRRALESL